MGLRKFIANIKFLSKYRLDTIITKDSCAHINFSALLEEIAIETNNYNIAIKDASETISDIIEKRASLCRFGDGELELINKKSIRTQTASEKLSKRLIQVLTTDDPNILIGIPFGCFKPKFNNRIDSSFWVLKGNEYRKILLPYLNFQKEYYCGEVSLQSKLFLNTNIEEYFDTVKKIWTNRDITIICGQNIFKRITTNIFDCAKSIEYLYSYPVNAFDHYDEILKQALKINKDRLVIIILGPTATVLAYDLHMQGYQALDFGHIAKSYDWWVNEQNRVGNFFGPEL